MKTEIYVITHKPCSIPDVTGYTRLQVGAALHDDLGYLKDDSGDHISELNPYYAELTGVYWLWRNHMVADNIGICHYRRYFINDNKQVMTMEEFEDILKDHDVIAAYGDNDQCSIELFSSAHNIDDMTALGNVIREIYPQDYPFFDNMLHSTHTTLGNLCVMPADIFNDYCSWLFNILSESSEYIHPEYYDDYHKKVFAVLAEGLLGVYIDARGLRAYNCRAGMFGEKTETTELKRALSFLVEQGRFKEAMELFHGVMKQRPDLTMPQSDLKGELNDMISCIAYLEKGDPQGLYDKTHVLSELLTLYREL